MKKYDIKLLVLTVIFALFLLLSGCKRLETVETSARAQNYEQEKNDDDEKEDSNIKEKEEEEPENITNDDENNLIEEDEPVLEFDTPEELYRYKFNEFSNLKYYKLENLERYVSYKLENEELLYEEVIRHINIGIDQKFYEVINEIEDYKSVTVLVNKYNKLPDNYVPELIKLNVEMCDKGEEHFLVPEAFHAFEEFFYDAKELGFTIQALGTYRSFGRQSGLWGNAVKSGRTLDDVDSFIARPAHSEHQTGLAVDVIVSNYSIMQTDEYNWYKDILHEYGFIIRYPKGKEHITGFNHEPWHLRYVGKEIAEYIYETGITFDEYYVMYLDKLN